MSGKSWVRFCDNIIPLTWDPRLVGKRVRPPRNPSPFGSVPFIRCVSSANGLKCFEYDRGGRRKRKTRSCSPQRRKRWALSSPEKTPREKRSDGGEMTIPNEYQAHVLDHMKCKCSACMDFACKWRRAIKEEFKAKVANPFPPVPKAQRWMPVTGRRLSPNRAGIFEKQSPVLNKTSLNPKRRQYPIHSFAPCRRKPQRRSRSVSSPKVSWWFGNPNVDCEGNDLGDAGRVNFEKMDSWSKSDRSRRGSCVSRYSHEKFRGSHREYGNNIGETECDDCNDEKASSSQTSYKMSQRKCSSFYPENQPFRRRRRFSKTDKYDGDFYEAVAMDGTSLDRGIPHNIRPIPCDSPRCQDCLRRCSPERHQKTAEDDLNDETLLIRKGRKKRRPLAQGILHADTSNDFLGNDLTRRVNDITWNQLSPKSDISNSCTDLRRTDRFEMDISCSDHSLEKDKPKTKQDVRQRRLDSINLLESGYTGKSEKENRRMSISPREDRSSAIESSYDADIPQKPPRKQSKTRSTRKNGWIFNDTTKQAGNFHGVYGDVLECRDDDKENVRSVSVDSMPLSYDKGRSSQQGNPARYIDDGVEYSSRGNHLRETYEPFKSRYAQKFEDPENEYGNDARMSPEMRRRSLISDANDDKIPKIREGKTLNMHYQPRTFDAFDYRIPEANEHTFRKKGTELTPGINLKTRNGIEKFGFREPHKEDKESNILQDRQFKADNLKCKESVVTGEHFRYKSPEKLTKNFYMSHKEIPKTERSPSNRSEIGITKRKCHRDKKTGTKRPTFKNCYKHTKEAFRNWPIEKKRKSNGVFNSSRYSPVREGNTGRQEEQPEKESFNSTEKREIKRNVRASHENPCAKNLRRIFEEHERAQRCTSEHNIKNNIGVDQVDFSNCDNYRSRSKSKSWKRFESNDPVSTRRIRYHYKDDVNTTLEKKRDSGSFEKANSYPLKYSDLGSSSAEFDDILCAIENAPDGPSFSFSPRKSTMEVHLEGKTPVRIDTFQGTPEVLEQPSHNETKEVDNGLNNAIHQVAKANDSKNKYTAMAQLCNKCRHKNHKRQKSCKSGFLCERCYLLNKNTTNAPKPKSCQRSDTATKTEKRCKINAGKSVTFGESVRTEAAGEHQCRERTQVSPKKYSHRKNNQDHAISPFREERSSIPLRYREYCETCRPTAAPKPPDQSPPTKNVSVNDERQHSTYTNPTQDHSHSCSPRLHHHSSTQNYQSPKNDTHSHPRRSSRDIKSSALHTSPASSDHHLFRKERRKGSHFHRRHSKSKDRCSRCSSHKHKSDQSQNDPHVSERLSPFSPNNNNVHKPAFHASERILGESPPTCQTDWFDKHVSLMGDCSREKSDCASERMDRIVRRTKHLQRSMSDLHLDFGDLEERLDKVRDLQRQYLSKARQAVAKLKERDTRIFQGTASPSNSERYAHGSRDRDHSQNANDGHVVQLVKGQFGIAPKEDARPISPFRPILHSTLHSLSTTASPSSSTSSSPIPRSSITSTSDSATSLERRNSSYRRPASKHSCSDFASGRGNFLSYRDRAWQRSEGPNTGQLLYTKGQEWKYDDCSDALKSLSLRACDKSDRSQAFRQHHRGHKESSPRESFCSSDGFSSDSQCDDLPRSRRENNTVGNLKANGTCRKVNRCRKSSFAKCKGESGFRCCADEKVKKYVSSYPHVHQRRYSPDRNSPYYGETRNDRFSDRMDPDTDSEDVNFESSHEHINSRRKSLDDEHDRKFHYFKDEKPDERVHQSKNHERSREWVYPFKKGRGIGKYHCCCNDEEGNSRRRDSLKYVDETPLETNVSDRHRFTEERINKPQNNNNNHASSMFSDSQLNRECVSRNDGRESFLNLRLESKNNKLDQGGRGPKHRQMMHSQEATIGENFSEEKLSEEKNGKNYRWTFEEKESGYSSVWS